MEENNVLQEQQNNNADNAADNAGVQEAQKQEALKFNEEDIDFLAKRINQYNRNKKGIDEQIDKQELKTLFDNLYNEKVASENAKLEAEKKAAEIANMREELEHYKNKECESLVNAELEGIFAELGITEEGAKKQALKMGLTKPHKEYVKDGKVESEALKTIFSDLVADLPALVNKKAEDPKVKIGEHQSQDEEIKAAQKGIMARFGL